MVVGTPAATPLAEPKLDRMSLRTTPFWVSTLSPLEPSPGYGPAVSSGICSMSVAAAALAAVVAALLEVEPLVAVDVAPVDEFEFEAHPTTVMRPAPPMSWRI